MKTRNTADFNPQLSGVVDAGHVDSANDSVLSDANAAYERYLISIVSPNEECTYKMLLHELNQMPFYWTVANDENRMSDALVMRANWSDKTGAVVNSEVSVLEVLVALAARLETDIMQDDEYGDRTSVWFWKFIHNLDLDHPSAFDDQHFDLEALEVTKHNVSIWLDRKYDPSGALSIFGQVYPEVDMTHPYYGSAPKVGHPDDESATKVGHPDDKSATKVGHPDARDVEIWSLAMTWLVGLDKDISEAGGMRNA